MEGVQSEIVGVAASCFVVVQTSKSGMVWDSRPTMQITEGRPDQCEQEQ